MSEVSATKADFEPKIIAFFCKWCTSAGADLAGTSRINYAPNVVGIRVMCSSRVDPEHVLEAFREGADGVLIGGCHPGDCHYQTGNFKTMRRAAFLSNLLDALSIDSKRFRVEWISASEGRRFAQTITSFTEEIRSLGPLSRKRLLKESARGGNHE
ncbi:MAG: methyl-viologen-reducing hydrogenase subunit delta [Spirochaetes bacterium]|nr:MAG: methyl-viologen-reducing hydrogenase subunit delta [Spirochaetota bacterium]